MGLRGKLSFRGGERTQCAWVKAGRGAGLRRALFALLAAGLLIPAALAGAEWTTPVNLSQAGQNAAAPRVGVDANGRAVFAWLRNDGTHLRLQARARSATGALSAVQTLSGPGQNATQPEVAITANGRAVFTWTRSDGADQRVQARTRSPAGTLSAVQTLSGQGQDAFLPQVAVDADGDAVFTWVRSDGADQRVQARARTAAGALSAIQTLSDAGQDAFTPELAVDATGDAVFTWVRSDGAFDRIQARARSAAGALSAVQTLSGQGQHAHLFPSVAVDATGDAVFAWTRFDGAFDRIQARARAAAGALSPVQTLSGAGQNAADPEVAIEPGGDAVFGWRRFDGAFDRIQARARSASGTLSPVQNVSDGRRNATDPQVAVDADGDAVFAWQRSDGGRIRIEARTRSAGGTLRPFTVLSDEGLDNFIPRLAVDVDGDAAVTWQRNDGATNNRIQASAGP